MKGELLNRKELEHLIISHGITLIVKNIEKVLPKLDVFTTVRKLRKPKQT